MLHHDWGPPSVSTEQHERLLQELKALQELLAVQDSELAEAREIIETFEDREFFDALAQAVISQLRAECDGAKERVKELEQELEQCKLNLEGHGKANAQLKEDLRLEAEANKVVSDRYERLWEEHQTLRQRVVAQDATIAKWEKITSTSTCCAYCGEAYPEGTPRFGGDALTEHIKVCSEHPMRQAEERIKALERRVKEEKAWAQHRKDMYVAVRKQLRRAGVIKLHEEITVEDAVERLLRQVPARTFDV